MYTGTYRIPVVNDAPSTYSIMMIPTTAINRETHNFDQACDHNLASYIASHIYSYLDISKLVPRVRALTSLWTVIWAVLRVW